jgi:ABC-type transporter Mla subunit MlaD
MNQARRDAISKIVTSLNTLFSQLEDIASEEREAQENKPEALQELDAADNLDSCVSDLESLIDNLEGVE